MVNAALLTYLMTWDGSCRIIYAFGAQRVGAEWLASTISSSFGEVEFSDMDSGKVLNPGKGLPFRFRIVANQNPVISHLQCEINTEAPEVELTFFPADIQKGVSMSTVLSLLQSLVVGSGARLWYLQGGSSPGPAWPPTDPDTVDGEAISAWLAKNPPPQL